MAYSEAGMSSDAAQALEGEYQVFLSFRGLDTRHNFTDFLYHGLKDAGVRVFRDEDDLQEGEVIGDNLLHAINNSILYIPIFSQNYASSKWCLRELAHIVKNVSKSEGKKIILPIFYDMEPEDVKLKTPPDSATLLEHEMKCPNEVKEWRKALEVVDKIKGWNVKKNQSQAEIVNLVVQTVLEKLEIKRFMTENLIGLDEQEQELIKLLDVNHCDVRLIGIYGMGGIGKTTVAKVIFNRFLSHFGKCCSFLEDVRVNSSTKEGIVELQKKLLSDVSSGSVEQLKNSEHGMQRIRDILNTKKVLVVLDDVDSKEHVKKLIGNSSLHSRSRIIITTRNKDILQVEGFEGQIFPYEMPKMDDGPARQLFCWHAFHQYFPLDDYCGLSREFVSRIGGLPLAIEVIGSSLYRKGQEIWVETLEKLREVPEKKILEKLRISYDDLDDHHKEIFLDIACFLYNENKTDAIYMWTVCKFFPIQGIEVLTSRCLVKIFDNDKLWMHDQLIALGRQIVREESRYYLGKRSRLWNAQDALQIIGTEETKHEIQALEISSDDRPIEIRNEDFGRLPSLRILILKCGTFVGDFAACYANLRWFSWSDPSICGDHLGFTFRADNLCLNQLVVCKFYGIHFNDDSKAWDLIKRAENLKVLTITWCNGITTIPNISRCSALERLTLDGCYGLKRIESFIGDLRSLIELKITNCFYLTDLPKEVGALVKLKCFSLQHCERLRELPNSLGNLTSLTELDLSGTMIMELPNFILQLKSLEILRFPLWPFNVDDLYSSLTCGISTLVNLRELDLSRRDRMKCEILVEGDRIPRTINTFHDLHILDLTDCHEIQELPELSTSLTYLQIRPTSLDRDPIMSKLSNLVNLLLRDGSDYEGNSKLIPGCDLRGIVNLSRLKWVELRLLNVPANPQSTYLSQPQEIVLGHLDSKPPVQLPSSNWRWRNLSTLEIYCCEVEDISLDGLSRLENLRVFGCERLKRLSIPLELRKLRQATVESCQDLVEIQVVDVSKSLEGLIVFLCESLTIISGLSYLKILERLEIQYCYVLTNVEGLNELESLKALSVFVCCSLKRLIDASCTKIPDDCIVRIKYCGYFIKDSIKDPMSMGIMLKHYRKEILQNTSKKISFTIIFHLGGKKSSERFEFVGGIKREKEGVDPYLVTYEGLVADVKSFGFCLKRMWYRYPRLLNEIKSDYDVNDMLEDASRKGFLIHLSVEGGVNSEWEGEYDEEMMDMLREEQRMKTDVYSDKDEAKWWGFFPLDSDSDFALMGGESETHGTSSVDLVTPQISFTIQFHLGVKKFRHPFEWGCIGGIEREKEGVDPNLVTYKGLIADVKNFGFRFKRMRYEVPHNTGSEIKCDWDVNFMLRDSFKKGSLIHLLVEGEVDSEWEGEYDDEMMKMLREQRRMKTDMCSNEDGAKGGASCPNEDSNFAIGGGESETHGSSSVDDFELERGNAECFEATTLIAEKDSDSVKKQVEPHEEPRDEETLTLKCYGEEVFLDSLDKTQDGAEFDISGSNEVPDSASVGESETDCNSSIDYFRLEPGNTECFEAKGNRRQMRDGRIGRCDSIDGRKTASIKNRKKDKDEIGELANPSDFVGSSGQTRKGVEHYEKSCKATTEVGDQRDFSSVKRDKNVEIDRVPTKTGRGSGTGCASNPGRYLAERGRGRGRASSSRNGEGLSLGRDAASTLGRGTASNSGRDMTLSLGMGRGSSSRTDTTKMGTTSNPRRGITSSSRSSASLSIGRGRGSTLGEGATVSSGRGMTLSLGTGRDSSSRTDTTEMGTASIPGRGITSSSPSGTSFEYRKGQRFNFRKRNNGKFKEGQNFEFRKGCD